MTVTIKNKARQLLVVTFNSGKTVHLAPQETSKPIEELEIKNNLKIEKLKKNSFIDVVYEKERKIEKKKKDNNKE